MKESNKKYMNREKISILGILFFLCLGFLFQKNEWSSAAVVSGWLFLIVISCSYTNDKVNPLCIDNTVALRGACAIEILLGHVGVFNNNPFLFANKKAGILIVGVFFMLSGYGLSLGCDKKKDYLKGFLPRRILSIFMPSMLVILCDRFISIAIYKQHYNSIYEFIGLYGPTWYIYELCVIYFLYYICVKLFADKSDIVVLVIAMVFVMVAYFIHLDPPYYGSTLCFPLGIFVYRYYEGSYKWKWERSNTIVAFVCLSISLFAFFKLQETFLGETIARNIAAVCFCIIVVKVLTHCIFAGKIIKWLGALSLEIFLLHEPIEHGLQNIGIYSSVNDYVFLCLVLLCSIVFAIPLKYINGYIKKTINKLVGC